MKQYGPLIEHLLQGHFVCAITQDTYYRQLQDEAVLEQVNHYLAPLNRYVAFNEDRTVAYLAWVTLNDTVRDGLEQHISQVHQSLLPLLEWMLLVQEVSGGDALMTAGDILKPADIIQRCEDNPSLRERLNKLAQDRYFNSASHDVTMQVRQIFRRLVEHGYVIQPSRERQNVMVTGKMDYLVELVRFLKDEEQLPIEEEVVVQEGMPL